MAEKIAIYSGTRNLYKDMVTAVKSLLANSSVDKVYFLIEDDVFPEWLPPMVETINVSGQTIFPHDGPNYYSAFTYMVLLRACYTKILPESVSKVLQLDVDTVVVDNIDCLWDIDMTGKWFSAAKETQNWYKPYGSNYYNIGVCMFNLDQMRKDHADDLLINLLNTREFTYKEQDALNYAGGIDKVVPMNNKFNSSHVTGRPDQPAIVHFAAIKNWATASWTVGYKHLEEYRNLSWDKALARHEVMMRNGLQGDQRGDPEQRTDD